MESVCPPPAVSGLRLHNALRKALNKTGAMVFDNVTVTRALVENKICRTIVAQQGGLRRAFSADSYIIATGGIFGKGIITRPAQAFERIFNIPLAAPTRLEDWAEARFFSSTPHAFASLGVTVDRDLRAVDENGETLLNNVFFAGRALQGHDFAAEKSGSGVAAVTGYFAGGKA
jgi:glycerol-3-phosphate dehydrogenase subunit B